VLSKGVSGVFLLAVIVLGIACGDQLIVIAEDQS